MAVIVIEPAVWPVTLLDAMPEPAVAAPRPVTVPAPAVLAKVTEVELSVVTTFPAASRTSAVSVRAPAGGEIACRAGDRQVVGGAGDDREGGRVGGDAGRGGLDRDRACGLRGDALGRDAAEPAVAAPRPVTVPLPAVLAKLTEVELSPVRTLSAASRTSAVSVRPAPEARLVVALVIVR